MKIKITIKKDSPAEKVMEAYQAQKEAFKQFVQSGQATKNTRTKQEEVAAAPVYH